MELNFPHRFHCFTDENNFSDSSSRAIRRIFDIFDLMEDKRERIHRPDVFVLRRFILLAIKERGRI